MNGVMSPSITPLTSDVSCDSRWVPAASHGLQGAGMRGSRRRARSLVQLAMRGQPEQRQRNIASLHQRPPAIPTHALQLCHRVCHPHLACPHVFDQLVGVAHIVPYLLAPLCSSRAGAGTQHAGQVKPPCVMPAPQHETLEDAGLAGGSQTGRGKQEALACLHQFPHTSALQRQDGIQQQLNPAGGSARLPSPGPPVSAQSPAAAAPAQPPAAAP